ncbi:hypothetical protein BpHYR1_030826 [Brachionus plicatilis]|uniref:Uncharacterized protein n=1 Tax=Brachionus plicatilis TaxID=10195 RepID=A0A3M7RB89_BRAPC|nr:hypothetical protein BpHYR1_030826 [Brachionus plicatilis]
MRLYKRKFYFYTSSFKFTKKNLYSQFINKRSQESTINLGSSIQLVCKCFFKNDTFIKCCYKSQVKTHFMNITVIRLCVYNQVNLFDESVRKSVEAELINLFKCLEIPIINQIVLKKAEACRNASTDILFLLN